MQAEAPTYAGTKIAGNEMYASTISILIASQGLIKEYERLNDMIMALQNEHSQPIADTWKHNITETEAQLKMGARVALRNVKKVLGADVRSEDEGREMEDGHGDEDMMEVAGNEEGKLNYELQKSLRYAERGIKRMVKGLPDDATS